MKAHHIVGLVSLSGMLVFSMLANAAAVCTLDLANPTVSGACASGRTLFDGNVVKNEIQTATIATASSIQPGPVTYAVKATGTATYPATDGTGGSAGAEAFALGSGSTAPNDLSAIGNGLFIGEFTATDPGATLGALIPLTINLGLTGELFLYDDEPGIQTASADITLLFTAVDSLGGALGSFFGVGALQADPLTEYGSIFGSLGFTSGITLDTSCSATSGPHTCNVRFDTSDMVNFEVTEGETFGLFLSLQAGAEVPGGVALDAHSDFLSTATLSIDAPLGVDVSATPATVPLPASAGLLLAAVLGFGARGYRQASRKTGAAAA